MRGRTAGCAVLKVECVGGLSTATETYCTSPMKVLVPTGRGRSVWAYTSSFGGGMVAGDRTRMEVEVGAGAVCFLGTQAWTKIYRNRTRPPSRHETEAVVMAGGTLIFAPDPVQAFGGSTYHQVQTFRLGDGASLMLLEWYTAGRMAMGERWAFDRVTSRNEVWLAGGRVFRDGLDLDAAEGALVAPHRLGRFNCLATLFLIGPAFGRQAQEILGRTRGIPVPVGGDLVQSASPVADGVVWRVAGVRHEDVARELRPHLSATSDILADDPWSRKW